MKISAAIILALLACLLLVPTSFAQLPENLQKIADYNNQQANLYAKELTFLLAFLAGVLSILSPCTLAFLPAFCVYAFKEKKETLKMTFVFGSGFLLGFVLLGILAAAIGTASILILQEKFSTVIQFIGLLFIGLGILKILGKGIPGIPLGKMGKSVPEVFFFGLLFTVGWSACAGPILAAILLMAAVVHNYVFASLLLIFYALGLLVPLIIAALVYEKYQFWKHPFLRGKTWDLGEFQIHSTNLIAGLMIIFLGTLFLLFNGTTLINGYDTMAVVLGVFAAIALFAWIWKITQEHCLKYIIRIITAVLLILGVYHLKMLPAKILGDNLVRMTLEQRMWGNIIGAIALIILIFFVWKSWKTETKKA